MYQSLFETKALPLKVLGALIVLSQRFFSMAFVGWRQHLQAHSFTNKRRYLDLQGYVIFVFNYFARAYFTLSDWHRHTSNDLRRVTLGNTDVSSTIVSVSGRDFPLDIL